MVEIVVIVLGGFFAAFMLALLIGVIFELLFSRKSRQKPLQTVGKVALNIADAVLGELILLGLALIVAVLLGILVIH